MKLIFNLLITFCVGYLGAVKDRCDYTYTQIGWFKYHEIPATYKDARLRCRYEGGILASPTTIAIEYEMINLIRDVNVFTGIHAISPGSYYSIDGKPLESLRRKWAENEPDNKNNAERCITLDSDGYFSDVNCDTPYPYICYKPESTTDVGVCGTPDSEYKLEMKTNKCYKFHVNPRPYKRAHFVCSAEGGHLAIINSETESHVIRDLFAKYTPDKMVIYGPFLKDYAFIGFHNYDESADWTTVEGQTLQEAGFHTFSPGLPDNFTAGEYCGSVLRNGLLNDLWCESHFAFICEKDPTYPPVCDPKEQLDPIDVRISRVNMS